MKIIFGLGWAKGSAKNYSKLFKEPAAAELFKKYTDRVQHDFPFEAVPLSFEELKTQPGMLWVCEREKKSKMLSSEDLAARFQRACDSGTKSLTVWIGGPDGLTPDQMNQIRSDLIWSFGPMTLPHELASVVAAEQIYRAVSILKNHPYHSGH